MSTEKHISASDLITAIRDDPYIDGQAFARVKRHIEEAPAVDAVVLPCKVGTQIWLTKWRCSGMRWLKLIEPKPRTIHHFDITKDGVFAHFKDGYVNVTDFGKTVFLTKEEAKAALAKMDGDGNG